MKRLLLAVCLIGVVFAGHSPNDLQSTQLATPSIALLDAKRAMTTAPKTPAPVTGERLVQQNANFERVPSADSSETVRANGSAPAPSVEGIFAPSLPQKTEPAAQPETSAPNVNAMWVVVIRGTPVHSGPSVSAPIVSYFAVGKNLNLLGSEQGWYQVFDPATSQRGWVYAQYYVEPSDGPGHKHVAAREAPVRVKATPAAAAPPKPVRRILQQPQFLAPPQRQAENAASRARASGESVMSLLERALQR